MKIHLPIALAALVLAASAAQAAPAKLSGTVTDIFGPRFVLDTSTQRVLVDLGPKGADKIVLKSGEKLEIEGNLIRNELKATRVTMADGHAYEVRKNGKTWREWLTGKSAPESAILFGAEQVKKIAADAGYTVSGEPQETEKHFAVLGAKDGSNYDLQVHRDGRILAMPAFGVTEAKKLAADKGYSLTGEPVAIKKHYRASATKDGKTYEIDLHRDGTIAEQTLFGDAEAQTLVKGKGYEIVGAPRAVDEHFEVLGKKDGKFYELHAHRDGKVVRDHMVESADPRWGTLVR
jgi:hypothetical protein